MDRSLWLLNLLRLRALIRRRLRGVRTLKGLLLAVVGALAFLPLLVMAAIAPRVMTGPQLDAIRLYGPLGLFAYCALNVALSPGDRAVSYSPAEVDLLFCAPFRRRQLLLYKVAAGTGAAAGTSLLMTLALAHHAARFASAFVGLFLALLLLYTFTLAVGLAAGTVGALAFTRGRRLLLFGFALMGVAAVWSEGGQVLALPPGELLGRLTRSPAVASALLPYRPFVMAFTSERLWPDLAAWSVWSLLVVLLLLALVLGLNAQFLEASASASETRYRRHQNADRAILPPVRLRLPMAPWWGGIGPNLWRQVTALMRTPARWVGVVALDLLPVGLLYLSRRDQPAVEVNPGTYLPLFLATAFLASSAVGYDFRTDLRQMEALKTLPVRPSHLVLGQIVVPVLVQSVGLWLSLGLAVPLVSARADLVAAAAALIPPVSLLMSAIENLYFLWFPYRSVGVHSFDVQALGRQLLLALGKLAGLGVASALAAGLGGLVYWTTGSVAATAAVVWVVVAGCGLGMTPLLILAFDRFDVERNLDET